MSRKTKKTKTHNKFYLLCIRDKSGMVLDIIPHHDYDMLLLEGQDRAREVDGSWEIFNSSAQSVDGSSINNRKK